MEVAMDFKGASFKEQQRLQIHVKSLRYYQKSHLVVTTAKSCYLCFRSSKIVGELLVLRLQLHVETLRLIQLCLQSQHLRLQILDQILALQQILAFPIWVVFVFVSPTTGIRRPSLPRPSELLHNLTAVPGATHNDFLSGFGLIHYKMPPCRGWR